MLNPHDVAGDIAAGGTALAGLILVFMGAVSNGFGSYSTTQQDSVRTKYRLKIWFAFLGFLASIASAGLALIGKAYDCERLISPSLVLLLIALSVSAVAALLTATEIG
jgi:hypothetical protein